MKALKLLPLVIFACSFQPLLAQDKSPITPELLWQMKRVGNPEVSPDGQWTVFTVNEWDIEANNSATDIYLLNNATGEQRRLTFSGKEGSPVWSPDGTRLAFVSRRHDGPAQVYILPLQGGEAQKITDLPVGVFGLKWFPDGNRIAFAANILPEYNGDWDKLRELQKKMSESKVTAKVTENAMYRYWDRWLTDGYYPRLFSLELQSGKVTDLMPHTVNYFDMMGGVSYDIAPDGQSIALSMNTTPPPYEDTNYDVFLLATDGSGQMTNITPENTADDSSPVFSPDGRYVLYGKQNISHFYADRVVMTLYDTRTDSKNPLSENIDLSCSDWFWSADGRTVYFHAEDQAMQSIFSIPAAGGQHTRLFHSGTNSGAQLSGTQTLVFNHHNLSSPAELYRLDLSRRDGLSKMTAFNDDILRKIDFGRIENVTFKGANDADVQMFINYPPNYDPSKKYPLVMMIHGGPHGTFGDYWHYRWNSHLFASPGYIVAFPNFHGSTSFGQDFAISIHGENANKPFEDIMKAADYLIERGLVDENRMAAAGGSYGGYMVSWIAGHTDRFAALVNHAGVYDLHLQFASDYSGNRGAQYGGTPWENFDRLNSQNPSQFAHNFKSPMLVIHGERDYRVPINHGLLVYGIYKAMGLDARLVYFPNENHWVLSPQNSIFWYNELFNWFGRYLKD
ncbi:MAG: S9 family peptidase [Bacteroides sp.]|jgi:dipeptidyl aminopeptidase/acylaminoacyl peptidase|nr:S9 family peptidase [Bacteroides sp.]